MAEARWARGGYPELFHYILTPGDWDDWNAKAQYLEQWFDTSGFGGGIHAIVDKQDPRQAASARKLFRRVVTQYPSSQSASLAAYYGAVILDYCLNEHHRAIMEYGAFVLMHPDADPFVEKANRRIAALRGR
jgi:outer membrane protein assembly factor BamD (BamD/ComL family)